MTGPEHYEAAQRHLEIATEDYDDGHAERAAARTGLAQVHAMLAVAAAVATEPARMSVARRAWREWADAVQPSIEWSCDICGKTFRTVPGGEPPDLEVCHTCKAADFIPGWD